MFWLILGFLLGLGLLGVAVYGLGYADGLEDGRSDV